MIPFHATLGGTLLALTLIACGTEGTEEAPMDGAAAQQGAEPRACNLLDLAAATQVLGPGTELPGGDSEPLVCMYSNPGVAVLSVQLGTAELYDQITILQPHTPVEIGERARYNVQTNGVVAVQLAKGAHSVTLNAQPIGTTQADYLEPMLAAARVVVGRLP